MKRFCGRVVACLWFSISRFFFFLPAFLKEHGIKKNYWIGIKASTSQFELSIHGKSLWSKPNGGTSVPKIWKGNGYNPNNKTLPKFWSCPWFGNAKNLVGLVGAQTKHTPTPQSPASSGLPHAQSPPPPSSHCRHLPSPPPYFKCDA
jgi:hypothetical protein